ncbi:Release factor glutamine methyltransferase [Marinomonas spartinae]|uniref:Release factor glutamine methyltransferase n=1 Tax=Marinomonas spartinae TaxID=1792290 RepID=A0A1A8TJG5_9GAMM|nr:peptide chain release factor N(5)-glutamine methyltransferase [Marinomonas spartinae]SBS26769.1 Release factor glutamine methyltransferase [Marinomonas spartinae]SBS32983.1 Release factor glutamine methyltransferase [Marinomonas spartinae]
MTELRIDELLKGAYERLRFVSDSAQLDAQLLLAHVLGVTTAYFYTWPDKLLDEKAWAEFDKLLKKREQGEPVAYLIKQQAFWSLLLEVAPCTLIPRADTECLVETALSLINPRENLRILDLGTGTGAIALALASECPNARVMGIDLIDEAVALAKRNAKNNQLTVDFRQSCWFSVLEGSELEGHALFDLIVSNPPYIDPNDEHLSQGDVRFEPKSALVSENHGLADIEHIIDTAPRFLKVGAYLLLEHGYDQAQAVQTLFETKGYCRIVTHQDLGGNDRVTFGCWKG